MLKTIKLSDMSGLEIKNSNNKIIGFDISGDGEELAKKSGKSKN